MGPLEQLSAPRNYRGQEMNVKEVLAAMDISEQLESVYDFLIGVLQQQEEIFYHGGSERIVSEDIKESVISALVANREEAREAFKAHLEKEIVVEEEEE